MLRARREARQNGQQPPVGGAYGGRLGARRGYGAEGERDQENQVACNRTKRASLWKWRFGLGLGEVRQVIWDFGFMSRAVWDLWIVIMNNASILYHWNAPACLALILNVPTTLHCKCFLGPPGTGVAIMVDQPNYLMQVVYRWYLTMELRFGMHCPQLLLDWAIHMFHIGTMPIYRI